MSADTIRFIIVLYLIYKFLKWIFANKNEDQLNQKKNSIPNPPSNKNTTLNSIPKKTTYQNNTNTLKESILRKTNNTSTYSTKSTYLHIAGIPHRFGKSVKIDAIFSIGQTLTAIRQRDNPHDSNAIQLYLGSQFVGFIPKDNNKEYSFFMDNGGKLQVKVYRVDPTDIWRGVGIEVSQLSF